MARTFVSRLTAALLIVSWLGCATGGLNSGNSSGNSSAGSNNSSAGSNNSSNASNGSSNNSRQSSASSQTNGNQTSQDSTANSSRGTTENSSSSNSSNNGDYGPLLTTAGLSVVVAGMGLLIWALVVRSARAEPSVPATVPPPPEPTPGAPNPPQPGEVPGTSPPPLPPPSPAQVQAAQVFLRANYAQLQQDLALGAGRSIEDLAAAAEIRRENLGRFGRVLRANRRELISLLNGGTPSESQSLAWLRRVGELASKDELLNRDAQAFAQRYAAAR